MGYVIHLLLLQFIDWNAVIEAQNIANITKESRSVENWLQILRAIAPALNLTLIPVQENNPFLITLYRAHGHFL